MFTRTYLKQFSTTVLKRNENQALGLGKYAIEFMRSGNPSQKVIKKTIRCWTG